MVGVGSVGATYAYALTIAGLARELVLIDRDRQRAEGEAMDLNHALGLLGPMAISAGGYEACADAHLVVITAGAAQAEGETRLDLAGKNAAIMREIVDSIMEHNPDPILLVVTNPVDVLTHVALKRSGLPPRRVIGSGTVLDSSRFRSLLSDNCRIDPRNVHAQILGEHGDSEVPIWSAVNFSGVPLAKFCPVCGRGCPDNEIRGIADKVKNAAYEVIKRKGATYYAIGAALVRITEAIVRDQHSVLTVSSLHRDAFGQGEVCMSMPTVMGQEGVEHVLWPDLSEEEAQALANSAQVLRRSYEQVAS